MRIVLSQAVFSRIVFSQAVFWQIVFSVKKQPSSGPEHSDPAGQGQAAVSSAGAQFLHRVHMNRSQVLSPSGTCRKIPVKDPSLEQGILLSEGLQVKNCYRNGIPVSVPYSISAVGALSGPAFACVSVYRQGTGYLQQAAIHRLLSLGLQKSLGLRTGSGETGNIFRRGRVYLFLKPGQDLPAKKIARVGGVLICLILPPDHSLRL